MDIRVVMEDVVGTAASQEKMFFFGKRNVSLLVSDREEDWEIWMSGVSDEGGRQGMSKDSGSEGTEEPGKVFGEMPVCRVGVVDGFMTILKQLYVANWHKYNQSMCALATRYP